MLEKKLPREVKAIRINPRVLVELKKLSRKTGLTFSELIRDAIEQYIKMCKGEVRLIRRTNKITLNEKTT